MPELKRNLSVGEIVANGYKILGIAGAGGMGVVYRALDVRLERTVALKFLPPEMGENNASRHRILREARTASALDHPNIGVIYGIEDAEDGSSCIVMAFYDGESLAERIRKTPMSAAEAVRIAIQMAHGLAEAHAHKIVHRDVKPSNVMLTASGGVRIVDFGLASAATSETASQTGFTGTVAYMSPEQAMGNEFDHRTDIWALGCVLAEMLTGHNPFDRETVPSMIVAILNEPPRGLDELPPGLQQVLYRALAKNPAERYPNCAELLADLESLQGQLAQTPVPVGGPKQRQTRPPASVRKARDHASVSLWGAPRPATRSRLIPILLVIAAAIFAAAGIFTPYIHKHFFAAPPVEQSQQVAKSSSGIAASPAAYEDYLKAVSYMKRYDKTGNLDLAISSLQQATRTDPRFALAYAKLGEAYRIKNVVTKDPKWLTEAEANARKGAELDANIPAVYVTLGRVHESTGEHELAMQEFQRALSLDPHNADAQTGLAISYENAGRIAEAEAAFQKAAALRPDSWNGYATLGGFYDRQSKFFEAVKADQHAIQLAPDNAQVYSNLGGACIDSADPKLLPLGEEALRKSLQIAPSYAAYANLGGLLLLEHRPSDAEAAIRQALKINSGDYNVWNYLLMAAEWQKKDAEAANARRHAQVLAEQEVKLQPSDAQAQSVLAYLYAQEKRDQDAATRIQTALALAPNDPSILSNVAQAYENMGDRPHALQYIEDALKHGLVLDQMRGEPTVQSLLKDPRLQIPHR